MESKNILKESHIKNHMCCYFDDISKIEDFDINKILINKKPYENILVYSIACKTLVDSKPLHIRFNKIHGFITVYDGTIYLVLFGKEKFDSTYIYI